MRRSHIPFALVFLAASACSIGACSAGASPSPGDAQPAHAPTQPAAIAPTASLSAATPPAPPPEPDGPVKSLREAVLASSLAYETVRSLSDEVGPRLAGSPGDKAAVAWALRALTSAGFKNVRAEPVKVPHWDRGHERGELTSPTRQPVALAALGGSVGTPPAGIEAEVIEVDSLDAAEKLDPAIAKGKIVFFNVKCERTRDGSGYGRAVGARGRGASVAAKLGAVGVVIRSIGTDTSRSPHTGAMHYADKVAKIPAAALSIPDADAIHRLLADKKTVRVRMVLGARSHPDADSANVVGDVEGSGASDEIVLLGAHLDSWDLGRGALDDGAGCGVVIEAARQIGKLAKRPRRTVRVVLFANEENGLAGAKAYAKAHTAEIAKHVLALEADLGAGRVYETRFLGAPAAHPSFQRLVAAVAPLGVAASDEDAHGGADLIPLFGAGVPVVDLRQDASLYFDIHHTANDTMEQIKREDLDQVTAAFAAAAYAAADLEGNFGRVPEGKRRPPW